MMPDTCNAWTNVILAARELRKAIEAIQARRATEKERQLRQGLCTSAAYMGGKIILLPLNDSDASVAEDPRA